jgi:hypothetical protein
MPVRRLGVLSASVAGKGMLGFPFFRFPFFSVFPEKNLFY